MRPRNIDKASKQSKYSKTFSKMASVLPQSFTTDYIPPAPPLVRSINELRWWSAVIYLEENPDVTTIDASMPHGPWTWRLERTPDKLVFTQNTYYDDKLMVSSKMDTNIKDREAFIRHFSPFYKIKND